VLQVLAGPYAVYSTLQGYLALGIEATLPLPQLLANQRRRSVKGFRASVLANWLLGDAFKMVWFFTAPKGEVPGVFKACGVFQAAWRDVLLGVQAGVFGDGVAVADVGGVVRDEVVGIKEVGGVAMEELEGVWEGRRGV